MKKWILLLILLLHFIAIPLAQSQIKLKKSTKITDRGLYFEGKKDEKFHFGRRITPHGDCIDVVDGYIFVTWYRGGMDDMHVMLSRKKIGEDIWKTIEFPKTHIGYRGNKKIGDSHNTIAIGISTVDNTIHLLYDMHAYSARDFPEDYFNYRISKPNAAIVSDEEFTIDLFNPKRNYLKLGENYERVTYPNFFRNDNGELFAVWRLGGSGNGNQSFALYSKNGWSKTTNFNNGFQGNEQETYSIYGSFKYLHGKIRTGFSVRFKDFPTNAYTNNSGLFYAYSDLPSGDGDWYNAQGELLNFPIESPKPLKLGEPTELGMGNKITSGPSWTVTESGAIHFISVLNGKGVHYFKSASDKEFSHVIDTPIGDMYSFNQTVFLVGLENGYPIIQSTPEGTNDWKVIYHNKTGPKFRHGNTYFDNGKLFFYAMEESSGQAQPIHLLEYDIN
ncbi:BNR-4 repeat-containing protein [Namhaeicola litoreus]|uniref:BNR-4 repeat-containing protein n=1 Tax=Namhaeicola litoreus TaxID=1052145 RepID=A0ABW3Y3J2_9FLAO